MDPFAQLVAAAESSGEGLPPVHLWNPDHCGDIGLEIRRDGSWWHEGTRITRQRLVKLFSTILRKDDDGEHYLVTPVEKMVIHVALAPFFGVRVDTSGNGADQTLIVSTSLDPVVRIDQDHPIWLQCDPTGEPVPMFHVRAGLNGVLSRAAWFDLASLIEEGPEGVSGVWSAGTFFALEAPV